MDAIKEIVNELLMQRYPIILAYVTNQLLLRLEPPILETRDVVVSNIPQLRTEFEPIRLNFELTPFSEFHSFEGESPRIVLTERPTIIGSRRVTVH